MKFCEVYQVIPTCFMIIVYEIMLTLRAAVRSLLALSMSINWCEVYQLV